MARAVSAVGRLAVTDCTHRSPSPRKLRFTHAHGAITSRVVACVFCFLCGFTCDRVLLIQHGGVPWTVRTAVNVAPHVGKHRRPLITQKSSSMRSETAASIAWDTPGGTGERPWGLVEGAC